MEFLRNGHKINNKTTRWLWWTIWKGLSNFGTSAIKFGIVVSVLFGIIFPFLYWAFDLIAATNNSKSGNPDFMECIFFSVITATTLGYGDYRPIKYYGQMLAITEVIIGLVLIGFLIQMISRKLRLH